VRQLKAVVVLARHGETLWNEMKRIQGRTNVALSDTGRKQAEALSAALAPIPLASIYCSPLIRARETAEVLGVPHEITPTIDEGFLEVNFGDWEGKTHSELREKFPDYYERWLIDPGQVHVPRAELLSDVQSRVMGSFQRVTDENDGKVVAVVGHGGVNRALLLSLLQANSAGFWRLRQDVACLNLIELSDGMPKICLLNSTAHFKTDYWHLVKEAAGRARISI